MAAVAIGRVAAARHYLGRVAALYAHGLGLRSGLRSAAAAAMARIHILTESWPEVSPSGAPPVFSTVRYLRYPLSSRYGTVPETSPPLSSRYGTVPEISPVQPVRYGT